MDSISLEEKVNILFKQYMGTPSLVDTREFYEEPIENVRQEIVTSQIWSEVIPSTPSPVLSALTDSSLDSNGNPMAGSLAGYSVGVVQRFIKVPMEMIPGTNGQAYRIVDATISHPLTNSGQIGSYTNIGRDLIPYNYDPNGGYLFRIYRSTGQEITPGTGGWIVDRITGYLTFYEYADVSAQVNETAPPLISFYKYIGAKGVNASGFSQRVTFTGGDTGPENVAVSGVVINDKDATTEPSGHVISSVQWGGDSDGSFRISLKVEDLPVLSSLLVEKMVDGVWVTRDKIK